MSIKTDRIASNLVKEISYILMMEVNDTDVKFATDLSYAKVYVTVFNQDYIPQTLKALNNAKGFIRSKLMERVDIRYIPELEFIYDESIEHGQRIEKIIDELHENDK